MMSIVKGTMENFRDCKASLENSVLRQVYFTDDIKTEMFLKEGFEKEEIYIAMDEKNICIGFIRIDWNFVFSNFPLLRVIAVKPECRGKGTGRRLLAFFEQLSFERTTKVFLFVSQLNPRARKLYDEMGYVIVGAVPGLYSNNGIVEFLMVKNNFQTMDPVI